MGRKAVELGVSFMTLVADIRHGGYRHAEAAGLAAHALCF